MPSQGLNWVPRQALLNLQEMKRLLDTLAALQFRKIRFTGGEPFMRSDFQEILNHASSLPFEQISITTNGTLAIDQIHQFKSWRIHSVNLSLDATNAEDFKRITRRDDFHLVESFCDALLAEQISLKVNMVVMDGLNDHEILSMARKAIDQPIEIRFIEEMPFNGHDHEHHLLWDHHRILGKLREQWPDLMAEEELPGQTAKCYRLPHWKGSVGIIAAWSRTFCGTCNRLRITAVGDLKTCLYGAPAGNIRDAMRSGLNNVAIEDFFREIISTKPIHGHAAEKLRKASPSESMATIGG
jgi:cyclic pyranopterin phosphate synthase